MKTFLLLLPLLVTKTVAFAPAVSPNHLATKLDVKRDEIAHEIQDLSPDAPKAQTHDENPWKTVLVTTPHDSRQHALKKRMATIKKENRQLDKHVAELENEVASLFGIAEVLAAREKELEQEIQELKDERNSLPKMAGRTLVLLGKKLTWPIRAVTRPFRGDKDDKD